MSTSKNAIRLPLHITISTLFIGIVVTLGVVLTYQSYKKSSLIILSSAAELHEKISEQIHLEFKATYRPVVGSLQLLALSPLAKADARAARIENLPLLTTALSEVAAVSGIQVGYPNGDYFIVRPLRTALMKERFGAPPGARFVVDDIGTHDSSERMLSRAFFDSALNLLQEDALLATEYDPRRRPWYRGAGKSPRATQWKRPSSWPTWLRSTGMSKVMTRLPSSSTSSRTVNRFTPCPRRWPAFSNFR